MKQKHSQRFEIVLAKLGTGGTNVACRRRHIPHNSALNSTSQICLLLALLATSCASREPISSVESGTFHGSLDVRWIGPDHFLFLPNAEDPFRFERANGEIIEPGAMYTDGGSTMTPLRKNPNFSPWGYGPAFVIHDWLFFSHSQGYPGYEELDPSEASLVLAEGIQTIMEADNALPPNRTILRIFRASTAGKYAQRAVWMKPWYAQLPHPEAARNQPSVAYDGSLEFHPESIREIFTSSVDELRAAREAEPRFGDRQEN